jgi:hypothetical protein
LFEQGKGARDILGNAVAAERLTTAALATGSRADFSAGRGHDGSRLTTVATGSCQRSSLCTGSIGREGLLSMACTKASAAVLASACPRDAAAGFSTGTVSCNTFSDRSSDRSWQATLNATAEVLSDLRIR